METKCFIDVIESSVYFVSVSKNTMEWLIIEQDKSLYRIDFGKRIGLAHTFRKPISYIEIHPNIYALVSSLGKKIYKFSNKLVPKNKAVTFNYYTDNFKGYITIYTFGKSSFSVAINGKKIADKSTNLSRNNSRFVEKILKTIKCLYETSIRKYQELSLK